MNTEERRMLLAEFVQANLQLDDSQKQEMEKLLATERYASVRAMNKTTFEKGFEKGQVEILQAVMEERFGTLPPAILNRLQRMSASELLALGKAVVRVESLSELGLDK